MITKRDRMKYENNETTSNIEKTGSKREKIKPYFSFLMILYREYKRIEDARASEIKQKNKVRLLLSAL